MTDQIDKVVERLAARIADRCESEVHNCEPADVPALLGTVTAELEPIGRVLTAAQWLLDKPTCADPDCCPAGKAHEEARGELREALADLEETKE